MRAIHWFRRDLRLSDNMALAAATKEADTVLTVFVLDPKLNDAEYTAAPRLAFLYSCLETLDASLQEAGGQLVIKKGDYAHELVKLVKEFKADRLYYNRDYSPYARKRDEIVEAALKEIGCEVKSYKDLVMFEGRELLTGQGAPYTVFTPYKRNWLSQVSANIPARQDIKAASLKIAKTALDDIGSLKIPAIKSGLDKENEWFLPAGEKAGQERLKHWAGLKVSGNPGRIENYSEQRNLPAADQTSRLSPFFKFGAISVRQAYRAALNAREHSHQVPEREGCDTWISELIWRDFYFQILANFPHVAKGAFQQKYDRLDWNTNPDHLQAWQEGRTGYPIVDAGMRQMNSEGWMHNRMRMIVASFLVKDLHINWQEGERYFWQRLVDGDKGSNNGGWQWVASTGTDAQPFFRIFAPASQSEKFDPDGTYIKRYVPELAKVPPKLIHEPWKMDAATQKHLGVIIGDTYPNPMVDHKAEREKTLQAFRNVRD